MTQEIIYKGIRDTNTFCNYCLKPKMFTKRNSICTDCGVNIPLVNRITYDKNAVYKIGFELEGIWYKEPRDDNILQREDGSVEYRGGSSDEYDEEDDGNYYHCGEYVFADPVYVKPYKTWESTIRNCYPEEVNDSCGGHFHTSWKDMRFYSILMDEDFAWQCAEHMRDWAITENEFGRTNLNSTGQSRLLGRLEGNFEFTKMKLEPELQLNGQGDRYTFFNYPYDKHGTIECRFLPQFYEADTYIKAVHEILDFMEGWVKMKCGAKSWHNERTNTKVTFKGQITKEEIRKHLRKQHSFTSEDCNWAENQV